MAFQCRLVFRNGGGGASKRFWILQNTIVAREVNLPHSPKCVFVSHLPFQQIKTDLKALCGALRVNKVLIKAVSHQSALCFP